MRRAQMLSARLFGAAETFFLVNGVTGGMLALLAAILRPGDKVLLSRLSHKSILNGLVLSGALPVFLPVEKEPVSSFPLNVSLPVLEKALRQHPDTRLVMITSPSYWGVTAELTPMGQLCRERGVFFAVDEAHGAHLPFYGDLPHSAAAGADFWLHSAHKSLGALTPGAFLHLGTRGFPPLRQLRFWLQAIQTSSPSYPVMISLDLARRQAALAGKRLFGRARFWARKLRRALAVEGVSLLEEGAVSAAGFALDPSRITLLLPCGGGTALAGKLSRECSLQLEMAGENYLLAICGPAQFQLAPEGLARAVARVVKNHNGNSTNPVTTLPPFCFSNEQIKTMNMEPFSISPQKAMAMPAAPIPLERSAGKICGEMVVSAPPGIPLLAPGEQISPEIVKVLMRMRTGKTRFQGASDPSLQTIIVINH